MFECFLNRSLSQISPIDADTEKPRRNHRFIGVWRSFPPFSLADSMSCAEAFSGAILGYVTFPVRTSRSNAPECNTNVT